MTAQAPDTIPSALASLARSHADVAAILAPGRKPLTFAGLAARVVEIRAALNRFGIGRGDRVASALPNGADTAVAYLGVAACATYVPLNPDYTEDEFERYFRRLRPKAIVVPAFAGEAARIAAQKAGVAIVELLSGAEGGAGTFELRCDTECGAPEPVWASADDLALILLTSGSTDRPKAVPIRHRMIMAIVHSGKARYALGRDDRYLHTMPMFHGHGLKSGLAVPLLSGSGVICAPRFDVRSFFANLEGMGATWYSAGYTLQQAIFDHIDEFRDVAARVKLRRIFSGSGTTDPKVLRGLEAAFGAPVLNRYSMSETGTLACEPMPPGIRKPGTVGLPGLNEIRIVGATGAPCGVGEDGEIVARGPSVIDGYLDDPALNAVAYVDGWFRTGDMGRLDEDGYLTITGRIKELINRGGEKIAPTEVERVLGEHPAIARACVFGVAHPSLGEEVVAAVVPTTGSLASERAIIEFARARLAAFKVPRRILFTSDFPKGATGKTDRRALADAYTSLEAKEAPAPSGPAGARSDVETEIAVMWSTIANTGSIGRDTDLFLSGGDSLKLAQLIAALQHRFGVEPSMRQIFDEGATVAGLARLVDRTWRDTGRIGGYPGAAVAHAGEREPRPRFGLAIRDVTAAPPMTRRAHAPRGRR
jgi:acyl-CoA synthetase (AMP-forming)/AMP-acid ligase II/acyl carrier protein